MLPLAAYNPWADIKSGGANLRLLTEAVEQHGFIGAKIYPPVGFLPTGNAARIPGLDPKELNATLKRFFLECNRIAIPVMTHVNSTQGRDYEADQNSRPDVWRALIDEMAKDEKVPLVNLGHFDRETAFTQASLQSRSMRMQISPPPVRSNRSRLFPPPSRLRLSHSMRRHAPSPGHRSSPHLPMQRLR